MQKLNICKSFHNDPVDKWAYLSLRNNLNSYKFTDNQNLNSKILSSKFVKWKENAFPEQEVPWIFYTYKVRCVSWAGGSSHTSMTQVSIAIIKLRSVTRIHICCRWQILWLCRWNADNYASTKLEYKFDLHSIHYMLDKIINI